MTANIIDNFFVALGFKIDDNELKRFKGEVNQAKESILGLRDVIGGLITGGVAMMAKSFLDTSAQFERFETILSTIEGSAQKGKESMAWVSQFATKTPYELDQVTDAFVKLRAYGMDPMNGLLTTLGDTAAAMGKPIMMAVEAIADAVNGENERLKEFGIKASKQGNQIAYTYTDAAGKQQKKLADANNRAMIQSTLEGIWNEKYAGAMDKLSVTWDGLWSNFKDSITRFKQVVMDSGPFQMIKAGLADLLVRINKAFDSGAIKRFGQWVGIVFAVVVKMFAGVFKVIDVIVSKTIGWKAVMIAFAAIAGGVFASALASTTKLVWALARSILAVNVAAGIWVIAALAIGAAIALIVDDIENWKAGNDSLIGDLVEKFPWIADAISMIQNAVHELIAFWSTQWGVLEGPLGQLGGALLMLAGVLIDILTPVAEYFFGALVNGLTVVIPIIAQLVQWFAVGLVQGIATVTQYLAGFIEKLSGALTWAKELLGLESGDVNVKAVSQAPAITGSAPNPAVSGTGSPDVAGGVLGTAGNSTSSQVTTNTTSIQAPITVQSPDPAKAGEAVKQELDRLNKQATRNGQSGVSL